MQLIAKGLGVSSGIVRGTVKIVTGFEDFNRFNEGDILVTHLTDPTMVPMMNKAAGIICNIGGLTSHPSIVSREMGIPCIVSAKDVSGKPVTDALKDGMIIEMNGTTGEIVVVEGSTSRVSVLTGLCVCPGVVEGKLVHYTPHKIYSREDIVVLDEFVTQNVLLLKDAGAILSSTGGITCHASLIAREFNIPCLVNVKDLSTVQEGTRLKVDTAIEEVVVYE